MKLEMKKRTSDMISGEEDLELLYTMRDFPVYMGVSDKRIENDLFADQKWMISKGTGMIQLGELVPEEILYAKSHNSGIGKVWERHNSRFSDFIYKYRQGDDILEVGGGNGVLNAAYSKKYGKILWKIVEPAPVEPVNGCNAKYIRGFWDKDFVFLKTQGQCDTLLHSHCIEHQFEIRSFMELNSSVLEVGGRMIFSMPNMEELIIKKYPYAFNFEHTYCITETYVDLILEMFGFEILEKECFEDHSIFYATRKVREWQNYYDDPFKDESLTKTLYNHNREIFMDYVHYYQSKVHELNKAIAEAENSVFIFGAHINTQLLMNFGLDTRKVKSVLDNDSLKQGNRLYGTNLIVDSPKVLAGLSSPTVLLVMGTYNQEIKEDIEVNINSNTRFVI